MASTAPRVRRAVGREDVGVDAVGHDRDPGRHPARTDEGADALGDSVGDRDHVARSAEGEGLDRPHHGDDRCRGTHRGGGVGPDVGRVVDVGDAGTRRGAEGQHRPHHGSRGRWRLDDDDVRTPRGHQPQREGKVEGQVGEVAADVAGGVPEHRPPGDPDPVRVRDGVAPQGGGRGRGQHGDLGAVGQRPHQRTQPEGGRRRLRREDPGREHHTARSVGHGATR